jgi:1-hydroxycarotenoid 3,4-desaturase
VHHNVFFAEDYAAEFNAIFRRRDITIAPTVYICAQDREAGPGPVEGTPERMLVLINAPADGDRRGHSPDEIAALGERGFGLLKACGLEVARDAGSEVVTTPEGFARLFPGSGGALYGRASHGTIGTFARPGAVTRLPGLYLAGGSVHPGPGIPMAAMSGRIAAARLLEDWAGTRGAIRIGAMAL